MGVQSLVSGGSSDDFSEELEMVMRARLAEQENVNDHAFLNRSGSAPPMVEQSLSGSRHGADNLSEELMRSDPAYIPYYHQNVNLNPRLPPPLLAKEDWRTHQRLPGTIGGPVNTGDTQRMNSGEFGGGESLFSMQPFDRSEMKNNFQQAAWGDDGLIGLPGLKSGSILKNKVDMAQNDTINGTCGFRRTTHPSSSTFEEAEFSESNETLYNEPLGLIAAMSELNLSLDGMEEEISTRESLYNMQRNQNLVNPHSYMKSGLSTPIYNGGSSSLQYRNVASPNSPLPNYALDGYPPSPLALGNQMGPRGFEARAFGGGLNVRPNNLASRIGNNGSRNAVPMHSVDPLYLQFLINRQKSTANVDFHALHKAYLEKMLRKSHYAKLSNGFSRNSCFGPGHPYTGSLNPMVPPFYPDFPVGSSGPVRHLRNIDATFMGNWPSETGINLEGSSSALLDEFKNDKSRTFELTEIAGHIVEFSTDQYGSRFIQQKLETADAEEKTMVFHEIMPHALSLMTDVFGNYVIQKFLEHGSALQIRKMAEQLTGHVLSLSLQMYGCRVIQKALEVVDLDQQTRMAIELDGHIMHCVRDQNGNHVIQKCIECIPETAIHYIIETFYDQIVPLSTHPYGCRVIQRVLEHCHKPTTQRIVMNAVMQSVCMLAQDQYGNYVVQHVVEHGKPHERSAIISELIGKIVQMSQQKFASNVIEKCLSFGTPEERQMLVDEMLGSTIENEPLQVLMKDQFANYVVQKVLETCDDKQLELILNRIKVHLNTLKKYTYGKHIVARVEKLVATGERRISIMMSSNST